ncbi:Zinc finger protein [Pseudolycoriella hygida]|uniref:Zinc finger protein n=1 Tax=Pseudolycoriella hygida TaxID=35572 RepID=A0A9Q0N8G0_9DIPT|nr:Zinc finger protein [Pseudolycoriella hygida]
MEYYQEIKWHEHAQHLMNTQKNIYLTSAHSDAIICCGDKRAKVHRLVLILSSDFFCDIFKEYPITDTAIIIIPELNPLIVDPLITFMYTGQLFLDAELVCEFVHACKFLKLKGMISYSRLNHQDSEMEYSLDDPPSKEQFDKLNSFEEQVVMHEEYIVDNVHQTDNAVEEEQFVESLITIESLPDDEQSQTVEYEPVEIAKYEIENESCEEFEEYEQVDEFGIGLNPENTEVPPDRSEDGNKKPFTRKYYSESALLDAFNDLANGATITDTSLKYNIPRSTLYCKIRSNTKYSYLYRTIRESAIQEATNAVVYNKLSLQQAASQFGIAKTVLWRKLRNCSEYKPEDKSHAHREQAIKAIEGGEKLLSVSKMYNIPISTLHRDKVKLMEKGKLPKHCSVVKRELGPEFRKRIEAAMESCRNGMTQKMASALHNVPKTTIWRYMNTKNEKS